MRCAFFGKGFSKMVRTCKCCKGTNFVSTNDICILCAKARVVCPSVTEESDEPTIPCFDESEDVASDNGLSRQCQQSEAPEETVDALVQQITEPRKNHGLVEATIDPCPVGRTTVGSSQGGENPQEYASFKPDDHPGHSKADCVVIFRNILSGAQYERVTDRIREIQPGIVVFTAVMRQSDIQLPSPLLIISEKRALASAACFPLETGTITLNCPGETKMWQPRFFVEKEVCMLAGHWLDFVCDNQVQAGDICIFVPEKGRGSYTFMVHLIRSEAADPRGVKTVSSKKHGTTEATEVSAVNTEGPSHGGNAPLESNIHGVSHGCPNGKDDHGSSKRNSFLLPRYTKLTTLQKKIVNKRVRDLRSEYPLYVGIIKGSFRKDGRIQHRQFEFCQQYSYAVHLPSRSQPMILRSMGKEWKTQLSFRKVNKQLRWMVVGGWGKFARETGLCYGDMCIFELKSMNKKALTMEVMSFPERNSSF